MGRRPSQYFLDSLEEEKKQSQEAPKACDVPGCECDGEYKAPKSNKLNEYYNFCLGHVQDYNSEWDYFDGLPQSAVETQIYNDMLWDRPTWEMVPGQFDLERLQRRVYEKLDFGEDISFDTSSEKKEQKRTGFSMPTPERDAFRLMGLEPPLVWEEIKARYRVLAKKYHPDIHGGNNLEAEEKIKEINLAYSVLKIAYSKYQKLEKI